MRDFWQASKPHMHVCMLSSFCRMALEPPPAPQLGTAKDGGTGEQGKEGV